MAKRKKQEAVLSAEKSKVIEHIVEGETIAEAARLADVQPADVETWLQSDAVFVAGLNVRQQDQHRANVGRLRSLAGQAVETLGDLLQSESESVRLKAATVVLKSVSLSEVKEPIGSTVAKKIEHDWAQQRVFDFW